MTYQNDRMQRSPCLSIMTVFVSLFLFLSLFSSLGLAQVGTNITPSGLGTVVASPNGTVTDITGGTRPEIAPGVPGLNLFHSFEHFSVGRNEVTGMNDVANFLNDSGLPTQNILSRVTGGNPSDIFGTIQTTNFNNANLFIMNSQGIVFGPNASLDIGGSLYISTANQVTLKDGNVFNASTGPEDALLTAASPETFGFLGQNPPIVGENNSAAIFVEGLDVINGSAVSLIGRDATAGEHTVEGVLITGGTVQIPNGQVNIVSIGASQAPQLERVSVDIVTLSTQGLDQQGEVAQGPVLLGSVVAQDSAHINTSGFGGGTVVIRGGSLMVEGSQISANVQDGPQGQLGKGIDIEVINDVMITQGSVLETNVNEDAAQGIVSGGIRLRAGDVELRGGDFPNFSQILSSVAPNSNGGKSGDIKIEANSISLQSFGVVQSGTSSLGNSGKIVVIANESLEMDGSTISTISSGPGKAGDIEVSVQGGTLSMTRGAGITTQASQDGDAGNITVSAESGDVFIDFFGSIFSRIEGSGKGGNIHITALDLEMTGNPFPGRIGVNNFTPNQPADGIVITLTGNLVVKDGSTIDGASSGPADGANVRIIAKDIVVAGDNSFISSRSRVDGQGGTLNIMAANLQVTDAGSVTSEAQPGASGNAGSVNINLTESLLVTEAGNIVASTDAVGNGGNINATARNISLTQKASIAANSNSTGNAGSIALKADDSILIDNSTLTTRAENALGGNIKLKAEDLIQITNSELTSRVQEGSESAGRINLDPDFVVIQNSAILSTAFSGEGGPITIIANSAVLVDPFSNLDASSQFGGSGTIDIQAPIQQLSGTIAPLPENIVKLVSLYAERCASQKDGQFSSFGKSMDSAPPPGEFLTSPLTFSEPGIPQLTTQASVLRIAGITDSRRLEELFEAMTWKISEHNLSTSSLQTCALQME